MPLSHLDPSSSLQKVLVSFLCTSLTSTLDPKSLFTLSSPSYPKEALESLTYLVQLLTTSVVASPTSSFPFYQLLTLAFHQTFATLASTHPLSSSPSPSFIENLTFPFTSPSLGPLSSSHPSTSVGLLHATPSTSTTTLSTGLNVPHPQPSCTVTEPNVGTKQKTNTAKETPKLTLSNGLPSPTTKPMASSLHELDRSFQTSPTFSKEPSTRSRSVSLKSTTSTSSMSLSQKKATETLMRSNPAFVTSEIPSYLATPAKEWMTTSLNEKTHDKNLGVEEKPVTESELQEKKARLERRKLRKKENRLRKATEKKMQLLSSELNSLHLTTSNADETSCKSFSEIDTLKIPLPLSDCEVDHAMAASSTVQETVPAPVVQDMDLLNPNPNGIHESFSLKKGNKSLPSEKSIPVSCITECSPLEAKQDTLSNSLSSSSLSNDTLLSSFSAVHVDTTMTPEKESLCQYFTSLNFWTVSFPLAAHAATPFWFPPSFSPMSVTSMLWHQRLSLELEAFEKYMIYLLEFDPDLKSSIVRRVKKALLPILEPTSFQLVSNTPSPLSSSSSSSTTSTPIASTAFELQERDPIELGFSETWVTTDRKNGIRCFKPSVQLILVPTTVPIHPQRYYPESIQILKKCVPYLKSFSHATPELYDQSPFDAKLEFKEMFNGRYICLAVQLQRTQVHVTSLQRPVLRYLIWLAWFYDISLSFHQLHTLIQWLPNRFYVSKGCTSLNPSTSTTSTQMNSVNALNNFQPTSGGLLLSFLWFYGWGITQLDSNSEPSLWNGGETKSEQLDPGTSFSSFVSQVYQRYQSSHTLPPLSQLRHLCQFAFHSLYAPDSLTSLLEGTLDFACIVDPFFVDEQEPVKSRRRSKPSSSKKSNASTSVSNLPLKSKEPPVLQQPAPHSPPPTSTSSSRRRQFPSKLVKNMNRDV